MVLNKNHFALRHFILLLGLFSIQKVFGEDGASYRIFITDVQRNVHKNWLGVPNSVDYTLYWEVFKEGADGWNPDDISKLYYYCVLYKKVDGFENVQKSDRVEGNFYSFNKRSVGKKYGFVIEGHNNRGQVAVSDTAWIVTGRLKADRQRSPFNIFNWIPLYGRVPLDLMGKEKFFDDSTKAGKIAFQLIWNFFLGGIFIWLFFCIRHLRLGKVFPLKKGMIVGRGYDEIYTTLQSEEFKSILAEWRDIVNKANENVRDGLRQGAQVSVKEIEGINAKFWRDEGVGAIRGLIKRINESGMNKYPAVKIIQAGLENHELGGLHWLEVSKEVDRAIENRASSELERLRRRSLLDWLWNLGTLSPLVGLFGTATGISNAFATLTFLRADVTQTELVKGLAGGIYEALWTTIEGLSVGIFLTLLYYYYQNKLNWIYSKWEEIYVYVSEKL